LRVLGRGHVDESETAGAAREFIEDQIDCGDRATFGEEILKLTRGRGERQIADVKFAGHGRDSRRSFSPAVPAFRVSESSLNYNPLIDDSPC
jgi:hypothetical protein